MQGIRPRCVVVPGFSRGCSVARRTQPQRPELPPCEGAADTIGRPRYGTAIETNGLVPKGVPSGANNCHCPVKVPASEGAISVTDSSISSPGRTLGNRGGL